MTEEAIFNAVRHSVISGAAGGLVISLIAYGSGYTIALIDLYKLFFISLIVLAVLTSDSLIFVSSLALIISFLIVCGAASVVMSITKALTGRGETANQKETPGKGRREI